MKSNKLITLLKIYRGDSIDSDCGKSIEELHQSGHISDGKLTWRGRDLVEKMLSLI